MDTPRLLFYSVIHTRPSQVLHRLRLLVKRKALAALAPRALAARTAVAQDSIPLPRAQLPQPLFAPRHELVVRVEQGLRARFLNVERAIDLPLDWHPADLKTGTRLWLLNLHYMEFLEGMTATEFAAYVRHWIHSNKPYRRGYWMDDWNSYALSIRVVVWMQQLARHQAVLREADKALMLRSLTAQLRFLIRNLELDIGGNHLIKNIKALLWAAAFFDGDEARRWRRLGESLLARELSYQILPDGMHFELSPAYHAQVTADLLECYAVLPAGAVRQSLLGRLVDMAQNLADLTHPDGFASLFNDGGLHMAYSPAECLQVFSRLIGTPINPAALIDYPDAGYFGLRDGDQLLLIDCGALAPDHLPAHGHGDALSFEWSLGGQRALIDPGVYEYNAGPLRAQSRSTRLHNTVTLDDLDQSEFWKAFRVGRRARIMERTVRLAPGHLQATAAHDGYRRLPGGPLHRRSFDMRPGSIQLHDEITGGDGQITIARLMLHPAWNVTREDDATVLCRHERSAFRVHASAAISVEPCVCFLDFGQSVPTVQLVIDYGPAPTRGDIEIIVIPTPQAECVAASMETVTGER